MNAEVFGYFAAGAVFGSALTLLIVGFQLLSLARDMRRSREEMERMVQSWPTARHTHGQ